MAMPVMTQEELLQRRRSAARTALQLAGFCIILLVLFVGSVMLKNRNASAERHAVKSTTVNNAPAAASPADKR